MRLTSLLSIFLVVVLYSSSGYASFSTAGDVYSLCTTSKNFEHHYQARAECRGYITGVFDHAMSTTLKDLVCLSDGITVVQAVKIFIAYVDRNPQGMHLAAESVIENAMYEAFKCKK